MMAYTYKKLSDVDLVTSATDPNLLIEDNGDIKKISASNVVVPQSKADWNETDANSSAFILNKPDLSNVGGANIVTYTISGTSLQLNNVNVTASEIINEWDSGSILRINNGIESGFVVGISYGTASGSVVNAYVTYFIGSGITPSTITI